MKSVLLAALLLCCGPAVAFDHRHGEWQALLERHVVVAADGHSSRVDYRGFKIERARLQTYLDELSTVGRSEFGQWDKAQRLAFLINAYNAWTIDLVLGAYPGLDSIKDLGSLFTSPWQKRFFTLLGEQRSLDDLEHRLIRTPGVFDEPRIHAALVCASIGCPMLRPEAFVAERLDAQLEDGMRRFLGDRSRNRFDAAQGRLFVSKIFDWYADDFQRLPGRFASLSDTFASYADVLSDSPHEAALIRSGKYSIHFLSYDWHLNELGR